MNGHDPYAYLKYVLTRLPTQRASQIIEFLPHKWPPVLTTLGVSAERLQNLGVNATNKSSWRKS